VGRQRGEILKFWNTEILDNWVAESVVNVSGFQFFRFPVAGHSENLARPDAPVAAVARGRL
jgi:hypothetical protein